MTDLKKLAQKLRDYYETPEGKKSLEKFARKMTVEQDRITKMWQFMESLSDVEYESLFQKFIKWEDAYEEREYEKGFLTSSNIFNYAYSAIVSNAEYCDDDSMFYGGGATYRGYDWKIFVGQGSFHTIEKNGERVFTST